MAATVLRASIEGALVVGAIWLASRCLRGLSPSTRTALWWCAAAKFIVALFWITPIAIPVLPAEARFPLSPAGASSAAANRDESHPSAGVVAVAETHSGTAIASAFGRRITATTALLGAWAAGVTVVMLVGFHHWRRTTGVVRRSSVAPPEIRAMAAHLALRLRLRRVPDARVSSEIEGPLVVGLLRPTVLLPARFGTLSPPQQEMTVCHELAHIARGDLWLGCVPALAERLFFFHPLARLASREYVFWRESACDATVLEALDAAPQEYGRLLLDLGVAQPGTSLAAAAAPWSVAHLKRRIVMLGDRSTVTFGSRLTAASALAITAVLTAPLQLVARTPGDVPQGQIAAPAARDILPSPSAPEPTRAPDVETAADQPTAQDREREPELNYVMFLGEERTWMSGSRADMERARRFQDRGAHLLWFRWSGREYVVRDRATMQQIEQLWRRVGELGAEQGKIGTEQGILGTRQGDLGTKQGLIGTEQGRLGTRQGVLGARQGQMAMRDLERMTAAQRAEFERERRQIDVEMRELDREMRALGDRIRELDKPMRDLGVEMEALGKQMEALGRQMQEEGRKAEREMRALLQRLVTTGGAELVK
jgi:bla regulator protein blaR1